MTTTNININNIKPKDNNQKYSTEEVTLGHPTKFSSSIEAKPSIINASIDWEGKKLFVEVGRLAKQATGSVFVSYGKTSLLIAVTASRSDPIEENASPLAGLALIVNFLSKSYATGEIPAGFFKREGKSTERDTLASRVIDRAIRPLIPENIINEINIVCKLLTYDRLAMPEIPALVGASIALYAAGIPFQEPVVGVNVGFDGHSYKYNPALAETAQEFSMLDLFVACTESSIIMVEAEAKEIVEEKILKAIEGASNTAKPIINFIKDFQKTIHINKNIDYYSHNNEALKENIDKKFRASFQEIYNGNYNLKNERHKKLSFIYKDILREFQPKYPLSEIKHYSKELERNLVRTKYLKDGIRIDSREPGTIRDIDIKIDYLPITHGSALFTRGGTQALVVATLGSYQDEQIVDDIDGERREGALLHYNFLPYAVGEVGQLKPPGRREIGHGRLAFKAIKNLLPSKENFAYTIRLVAEILESDGSSSMATVCGASLALMDTGVPLKKHIAGIAMGLVKEGSQYVILSDISGDEDALGDMDFKVAGTTDGITALQMDIKTDGINIQICQDALKQALEGRLHILEKMNEAVNHSNIEVKDSAPKIVCYKVPKEIVHKIIGAGGKTIKGICEENSVKIDIDAQHNLYITAEGRGNLLKARAQIDKIINVSPLKVGTIYEGTIVSIVDFGLFIELGNTSQQGLLHVSEVKKDRTKNLRSLFNEGDKITVKIKEITSDDKIRLTLQDSFNNNIDSNNSSSSSSNSNSSRSSSESEDSNSSSASEGYRARPNRSYRNRETPSYKKSNRYSENNNSNSQNSDKNNSTSDNKEDRSSTTNSSSFESNIDSSNSSSHSDSSNNISDSSSSSNSAKFTPRKKFF